MERFKPLLFLNLILDRLAILAKKITYGLIGTISWSVIRSFSYPIWRFWGACSQKSFSEEQLKGFETGVKYQMYHAILLLVLGFNLNLETSLEKNMIYCFILGTFLFSFSIYGLTLSASKGKKLRFLGPITPIGGLLLAAGWGMLLYSFIQNLL